MRIREVILGALFACLFVPASFAGLFLPQVGTGSAAVSSLAYGDGIGNWVYEYVISGATVDFSFFSVGLNPGVDIISYGCDFGTGIDPFAWEPVNNPPSSIGGFFTNSIGPGETSSILWFVSSKAPTEGVGSLTGFSGGQYHFAVGTVWTPIPEPATALILSAGAAWLVRRTKR